MGDHGGWKQHGEAEPNGLRPGVVTSVTRVLDAERWAVAERRTAEIIARIQPSEPSEQKRKAVTGYVQQLITNCFPCQVFTFGSVPLKTYLPDGDIDLSAFSDDLQLRDTWANIVRQALENEEKRENAEFHVKEIQYIQAEVKIIKCLVENIVVDISFNQLGGLCTLCFLDEIDHLIDHNHLFKRSIILIKAWCYYESRILGAHHGLISTYALETLVLYIFHVFNNSFSGPLEVLFRFMEFFSKFDWENFCLSLWGPVPISSLPDTTADSPLKDSRELLLSKLFLKACSTVYAVFPATQDSQGSPFVPKHFNIIDPLRTNNNLGRSVSRGNFYRIRSALGFGAERLTWLNECPENILIAEVDNFFVNTWRRHGVRNRPDEPVPVMGSFVFQNVDNNEEMKNKKNISNTIIKTENAQLHAVHGYSGNDKMFFGGMSTQSSFSTKNSTSNTISSHTQCHEGSAHKTNYETSEQPEKKTSFSEKMAAERFQKTLKPHSFARTHSSPDLSGSSVEMLSGGSRNRNPDGGSQLTYKRLAPHVCGRNMNVEVPVDYSTVSLEEASLIRHSLSERDLAADVADSNGVLHGHQGVSQRQPFGEKFTSASVRVDLHQKMCQDEQDMINMMALSSFSERVQPPINVSTYMRLTASPVLFPNPYSQRPVGGIIPSNVPLLRHPLGTKLQLAQGLASLNYFQNAGLQPNNEDKFESRNDTFVAKEFEQKHSTQGYLLGKVAGTTSGFLPHKRVANSPKLHSDIKRPPSDEFNYDSVSQLGDSNEPLVRNQDRIVRENTRLAWDTDHDAHIRCGLTATGSSSRSENVSESWDSTSTRSSKSGGKKQGRSISSGGLTSSYKNTSSVCQYEDSSPDQLSMITDDDDRECLKLSTRRAEMMEQTLLSPSLATAHMQGQQVSGYSSVVMNGPDSGMNVPPVVYCNDFQNSLQENSRMAPFAFFATGPPVPYLIYPKPTQLDDVENQLNVLDSCHVSSSFQTANADDRFRCANDVGSLNSMDTCSSEQHEEHTPDILNSDFVSHWQNLQFGRFCHAQPPKSLVQASPMVLPQMHMQGNNLWSGPDRPITANTITYPQIMNYDQRLIPMMPVQAGSRRPSSAHQSYREEISRNRLGTGTFLPNHASFRDKQNSGTRHYRGNYNHERKENVDREGSWVNSKSRYGSRNRVRTQFDRHSSRVSHLSTSDGRAENTWETHNQEKLHSYQTDASSSGSIRSNHVSTDSAHAMYPLSADSNDTNSSGPMGPFLMVYPYDNKSTGYGSSTEQAESGSVGSVHLTETNHVSNHWDRSSAGSMFEKRRMKYQHSSQSSPERHSSPEPERWSPQKLWHMFKVSFQGRACITCHVICLKCPVKSKLEEDFPTTILKITIIAWIDQSDGIFPLIHERDVMLSLV